MDQGQKEIIKNASFSIKEGEFAFITGPSGSGKSTTFKIMLYGAIKPKRGELYVGGLNMNIAPKTNFKS